MKGSFEKIHDWFYKWFFERNKNVQRFAKIGKKYDLPMDPKQEVWTTEKENEGGSKTRSKLKVTKNATLKCWTCFISMAIFAVVFVTLFYNQPVKSKMIFL